MTWYEVQAKLSHQGAGRHREQTIYVFAESIVDVLKRYRSLPGVKAHMRGHFPDMRAMSSDECAALEERINDEKRITLVRAKKTWYLDQ